MSRVDVWLSLGGENKIDAKADWGPVGIGGVEGKKTILRIYA